MTHRSYTGWDVSWKKMRAHLEMRHQKMDFWQFSEEFADVPPEVGAYGLLGEPGTYTRQYAVRQRTLDHNGVQETLALAPAWLFSGEADSGAWGKPGWPGRTQATYWGHDPPPMVLAHFVCTAWPGSGGRVAAIELWGKWFAQDVEHQLRRAAPQQVSSQRRVRETWLLARRCTPPDA